MYIEFTCQEGGPSFGGDEDDIPLIVRRDSAKAKLKFTIGAHTVVYYGEADDAIDAAQMAIQAFLSGEIYHRETSSSSFSTNWGINFDPSIPPSIREIIEIAIDLKTGSDRNKLEGLIRLAQ